jgi:hypothetical protein
MLWAHAPAQLLDLSIGADIAMQQNHSMSCLFYMNSRLSMSTQICVDLGKRPRARGGPV